MIKQSKAVSVLLVGMLFLGLMVADAFGYSVTLSPDPLFIDVNSVGIMTVTLSEPAPVGGSFVNLSTSDFIVTVPVSVNIADGLTAAMFDVTSIGIVGEITVTAMLGPYSDTAIVMINEPSSVPIPPSVWLLGSGLLGFVGVRRRVSGKPTV